MTPPQAGSSWPALHRVVTAEVKRLLSSGHGVLLDGAAGVGKSHTASEVCDTIGADADVVRVIATPADRLVPLAALNGWLTELGLEHAVSSTLAPQQLAGLIAGSLDGDSTATLVFVDDVNHLDSSSADLLAGLVHRGTITLLTTWRSTEGVLPAPIRQLLDDGHLLRVEVTPLAPGEVSELLALALGGPVHGDTARSVYWQTEGNALFLRELIRGRALQGALVEIDGTWHWPDRVSVPLDLPQLFSARLTTLSADARDAVELVALAEPISISVLERTTSVEVIGDLVGSGLLLEVPVRSRAGATDESGWHVRTYHPLFAESVRSRIGPWRRKLLFERLRAVVPSPPTYADAGVLRWLNWAAECGADVPVGYWLAGAGIAAGVGDLGHADGLATRALMLPSSAEERIEGLVLRAEVRRFRSLRDEAIADLEAAEELIAAAHGADRGWLDRQRRAIGRVRADILQYLDDDAEAALRALDGDDDWQRRTRLAWAGEFAPLRERLPEMERAIASTEAGAGLLEAVPPALLALAWQGRTEQARALARAAVLAVHRCDPRIGVARPGLLPDLQSVAFLAELYGGEPREVVRRDFLPRLKHAPPNIDPTLWMMGTGRLMLATGAWSDADRRLGEALTLLADRDPAGFAAWTAAARALAAAGLGDRDRARKWADRAITEVSGISRALEPSLRVLVLRTHLAVDPAIVGSEAVHLARWARDRGHHLVELEALATLGIVEPNRIREPAVLARAESLGAAMTSPVGAALLAHLRAVAGNESDAMRVATRRLARLGRHVVSSGSGPDPLTRREREVATLVAAGLTTPDIAARLHVSTRTVESHIARIFLKLGVNRRADVGSVLANWS